MSSLVFNKVFKKGFRPVFADKAFSPTDLFLGGALGVWYNPSDPATVFTDPQGLSPAAGGSTVALLLDKANGSALGAERVANGDFSDGSAGWTNATPTRADYDYSGGRLRITNDYANGSTIGFGVVSTAVPIVLGRTYRISLDFVNRSGTNSIQVSVAPNSSGSSATSTGTFTSVGAISYLWTATVNATHLVIVNASSLDGAWIECDNISVRELPGYQATQLTASSRPTFTSDKAVENVSSDSLNWTAPAGTYTIAYRGDAGVVILDGQALSGATNIMQTTKIYEYIAVDRALGSAEKRQLQAYLEGAST